jgi:hypothetical protein
MTNPATTPPPRGGMPKWLILLLVLVLVIILGCCGGVTTCFFLARKAARSAPDFIREHARANGVDVNIPGSTGGAVQLPANFPSDVPPYAGATIIISNSQPNGAGSVTFTTPDTAAAVKTFYDDQLTKNGWTSASTQQSGTVTTEGFTKDDRTIQIEIVGGGPSTNVSVVYTKK